MEIDREELLRFCILKTYGVDVRPPAVPRRAATVRVGTASRALHHMTRGSTRKLVDDPATDSQTPTSTVNDVVIVCGRLWVLTY